MNPTPFCPFCRSHEVVPCSTGYKIFGAIGLLAGAAGAIHAALKQPSSGTLPLPDIALSSLAGAALAALSASALGCRIGTKAGAQLDDMLLGNRVCLNCKHRFSCL